MSLPKSLLKEFLNTVSADQYLYVTHDESGNIDDFINTPKTPILFSLLKQLQLGTKLSDFFIWENAFRKGSSLFYRQRKAMSITDPFFRFYTDLTQIIMASKPIESGLYLGRIAQLEFYPVIKSSSLNSILMVDNETDAIRGFSDSFYSLFSSKYANPIDMIGKHLREFITPSPAEFQKAQQTLISPSKENGYQKILDIDFKNASAADYLIPYGGDFTSLTNGCKWTNNGNAACYALLKNSIRTKDTDFILTLEYDNLGQSGLFFILGANREFRLEAPDDKGYSAGDVMDIETRNTTVIKRNGDILYASRFTTIIAGRHVFDFCKTGETISVYKNNELTASYVDTDFLHAAKGQLVLALRPGKSCLLSKMVLKTKVVESAAKNISKRLMCRTIEKPTRYFVLDRFYSSMLGQTDFLHISGFLLSSVTEIQEQAKEFGLKYKSLLAGTTPSSATSFICNSSPMNHVRDTAVLAAKSDATVLIEGPTGAGKEVLARFIHESSKRKDGPFVKVDCATVPQSLIESHLFGHEKGAFTGAIGQNIGLFEAAQNGTIFLDEIGNLNLEVQAKLLQFFNDFTITRVGSNSPIRLDIRMVAASNVKLKTLVKNGLFREDLYYRLNVISIVIPPLKERKDDILPLSRHFLNKFTGEQGKDIVAFTEEAEKRLLAHDWPGNVRELANVVQRAVIFCNDSEVPEKLIQMPDIVSSDVAENTRPKKSRRLTKHTLPETVLVSLRKHDGNATLVAKELKMSRTTLYKFLEQNKMKLDSFRKGFNLFLVFFALAVASLQAQESVKKMALPAGYTRLTYSEETFSGWVQSLKLKADKKIRVYDGSLISEGYFNKAAVVEMPLLFKVDIEQCADYCMRLWAEYHKTQNSLNKLYLYTYSGEKKLFSASGKTLNQFLKTAFSNTNSFSLKQGCKQVVKDSLRPGDMFVQNGNGGIGHVSMIVDMCEAKNSSGKLYRLGFSFMPAQEFHIEGAGSGYGVEGWFTFEGAMKYLEETFVIKPVLRRF
ncbi:MAG: sigma 54-interacting transcriptional regulator [Fibrobacteres bacterium]|nr:sigma 54-interacting transcriptional regulator [Fibrobacterota bacterium]